MINSISEAPVKKIPTDEIRLGFLGLGWIGQSRMNSLVKEREKVVGAVCDVSEEVVREACAGIKDFHICGYYEEMLQMELDGIVIATPSAMHARQALKALENDKAVFVQKPLSRTAAETRAILALAEKKDKLLGVDFSYRHCRGLQMMREMCLNGNIGEVYAMRLVFHNAYGPGKDWYYQSAESGGGCLTDLGIHLLDSLFWFNPGAKCKDFSGNLYQQGKPVNPEAGKIEDFAQLQLELDNGISAQLACSWNLSAGRDAVIEISLFGTEGGMTFQNVKGSFYDFETWLFRGTRAEKLDAPPEDWGGGAINSWADKLASGKGFDKESWQYLQTAQCLDEIYGRGT